MTLGRLQRQQLLAEGVENTLDLDAAAEQLLDFQMATQVQLSVPQASPGSGAANPRPVRIWPPNLLLSILTILDTPLWG